MLLRTVTVRLAPAALLLLPLGVVAAGQDVERPMRVYDIALLVEPVRDRPGPSLEPDWSGGLVDGAGVMFGDEEGVERLDPDALVELIRGRVSPDSWNHADNHLDVLDGTLQVVQTVDVHAEVAAFLGRLQAELGRQVEVQVAVYAATPHQARALLARSRDQSGLFPAGSLAAALPAAGLTAPLEQVAVTLRDGQRGHAAALQRRGYVRDYDVEVAQKITGPDPVIDEQVFGLVADCTAVPSRDGEHVLLECRLAWAALVDDTRRAEVKAGLIELPERVVASVRAAAVAAYGESWMGVATGPGGRGFCFVVTPLRRHAGGGGEAPAAPEARSRRVSRAYNLGELIHRSPDFAGRALAAAVVRAAGAAGGIPGLAADEGPEPVSADNIAALIQRNVEPDSWGHKDNHVGVRGATLLVTQTPAVHDLIEAWLRSAAARRPPGVRVETALVAADAALLAAVAGRTGAALDGAMVERWLAAAGDRVRAYASGSARHRQQVFAGVIDGVRVVGDFDVEVAPEAQIADPVVVVGHEGFVVEVRPVLSGDQRTVALALRPGFARLRRPVRMVMTAHGEIGLLEATERHVQADVVLPTGQWGAVRAGTDADGEPLVLLAIARAVR